MPNRGEVIERMPGLERMARGAGRGPIPVTYYPRASAEEIERLEKAGVERCIRYVPPDGRDAALRKLDELGQMIQPYSGDYRPSRRPGRHCLGLPTGRAPWPSQPAPASLSTQ